MTHSEPLRRVTGARGRRARELTAAKALLGGDHRLVRALNLLVVLRRQLLCSSSALAGGGIATAAGVSRAAVLLVAAALVDLVLVCAIVALRSVRRDLARELIIEGRGDLPLDVLAHERQRLTSPRTQQSLARALEHVVRTAATWPQNYPTARPIFDVRQVRVETPQLRALAKLLRGRPAQARPVALIERLLTSGGSPLYGYQPDELRRELELIREELDCCHRG